MIHLAATLALGLSLAASACGGETTTVINQTTTVTEAAQGVVIPDVVGDEASEATKLLESENLRVRSRLVYQYDSLIQIGQVAEQIPPAGTSVPEFTVVTLRVAGGE